MKIFSSSLEVPKESPDLHMAVGNFDGLHLGHQKLLQKALMQKRQLGGELAIYSFRPHPQSFFQPEKKHIYLECRDTWHQRLRDFGVDLLIEENFTKSFSELSPAQFLEQYWNQSLSIKSLVVGTDFRFGFQRLGDFKVIDQWALQNEIQLFGIEPVLMNQERVSTSKIKSYLNQGLVVEASQFLGRPFSIRGKVEPGHKKGRELGFPTLNVQDPSSENLKRGVYITIVRGAFDVWTSVTNVGVRPTVHEKSVTLVESHILGGFQENLYGQNIEVEFLSYVRPEMKFSNLEQLKNQISEDVKIAENFFEKRKGARS